MRILATISFFLSLLVLGAVVMARPVLAQVGDSTPSASPVNLTDLQDEYSLESNIDILRDPTQQLTIQDVASPEYADQFVQNSQKVPNLGITKDAVWVRLRVRDDSTTTDWRLALNDARMGLVSLYVPSGGVPNFIEKIAGRDLPFTMRDVPHRDFVFRFDLPRGAEQTMYMRLTSTSPMVFPLTLLTVEALAQKDQRALLFLGLFYGAMVMMAGYNLFLFFSLRDTNYLYLALFIIFYSLSSAVRDGLAQQYLWPSLPDPFFVLSLTMLTLIFQIRFTMGILDTRVRVPKIHRLLNGLVAAGLVVGAVSFFVPANALSNLVIAVTLITEGVAAIEVWQQGFRAARLYLVSWVLLLVVGLVFVLSNLNFFSGFAIPESTVMVATALGALFWSLAMADRVNLLKAETESVNRRLERSERKYRSLFENSRDAIFITTREGRVVDLNPAGMELFGFNPTELDEIDVRQVYAEPAEREHTTQAIETQGFVKDYPVHMRRKDGGEINALITSSVWHDDELNEAGYQGIVRDITQRQRIEAELELHRHHLEELVQIRTEQAAAELAERERAQEALQSRIQELTALNEIANTISEVTDLQTTLEHVAGKVAGLFTASATLIMMLDHERSQVKLLALHADSQLPEMHNEHIFDLNDVPIFRQVVDQNKPLVIAKAQSSPLLAGMLNLLQTLGTQALLLVPLRVHNDVIGVMTVNRSQVKHVFSVDEITLAETVASEIATAIENVRLYQQAQAIAVEQERHRLARELHDSVIQTLYSTVLLASGWRMMAEQGRLDPTSTAVHFQQVAEQSEQALKEMRLLLFQLRPPVLEQVGLVSALQQRLDAVEHRVGIETSLLTSGEWQALPPYIEEQLYNITQEALNNALRHAHAKSILMQIDYHEQQVVVIVEDNGRGFDLDASSGGMGLRNMRERANEIGAAFSLTTAPHQGTKIEIRLALMPDESG
jgi:PAS domain S-box-containing protein